MSRNEPFLSRWSRRKRQSDRDPRLEQTPDAAEAGPPKQAPAATAAGDREPATAADVDLSHLPPLDSIDATTDIRAFLARGVPAVLGRAALRRAWAADPVIRDFVGLSENAWDFTAPETIPGFGPLPPDAARTLAAEMFDRRRAAGLPTKARIEGDDSLSESEATQGTAEPQAAGEKSQINHTNVNATPDCNTFSTGCDQPGGDRIPDKVNKDVAMRETSIANRPGSGMSRRRHGGALPG